MVNTDPCIDTRNPCVNGICNVVHNPSSYHCACYMDYTGLNCDSSINQCDSNPCVNGQCVDRNNSFTCDCTETGYNGDLCQTDINECQAGVLRCLHGGSCINTNGGVRCDCPDDTTGESCETTINECEYQPCINGNCFDNVNRYRCDCESGFDGIHCENDIDECLNENTEYCVHGNCSNTLGSYSCNCTHGYHGEACNKEKKNGDGLQIYRIVFYITLACAITINTAFLTMVLTYFIRRRRRKPNQAPNINDVKTVSEEHAMSAISNTAAYNMAYDLVSESIEALEINEVNVKPPPGRLETNDVDVGCKAVDDYVLVNEQSDVDADNIEEATNRLVDQQINGVNTELTPVYATVNKIKK